MFNRYNRTTKLINNSSDYQELFDQKKIQYITQYSSFDFNKLKNIQDYDLDSTLHVVQPSERLYMISQKYYGSPEYGWLICYTNKISNELSINIGTVLTIYFPLNNVLGLF
jgi:hypothetical protein